MKKLTLILAVAAFVCSPLVVTTAEAGPGRAAVKHTLKAKHAKAHHHHKHHKHLKKH